MAAEDTQRPERIRMKVGPSRLLFNCPIQRALINLNKPSFYCFFQDFPGGGGSNTGGSQFTNPQ